MLKRCYSAEHQYDGSPYTGCSVHKDWHRFSTFKLWMAAQDWQGKELDKDIILPGNKMYSPTTCVFVSREVNDLIRERRRGLPTGVVYDKSRGLYKAQCSVRGKLKYLGRFAKISEAAGAYATAKIKEILRHASLQTDVRVCAGLIKHAERLRT
jgi:hypothetical protein